MILVLQLIGKENRLPNAIITGAKAKVVVKVAEAPVAESNNLNHGNMT